MTKLHEIPVVVVRSADRSEIESATGDTVLALLGEVEARLITLLESGESATIDLKWLIHAPKTIRDLDAALGTGEVTANVACLGDTRIQETAIPCVWRISHRDPDGRSHGEFLEITEVPQLLRADRLMIPQALSALRANIASVAELLTRPEAPTSVHP